MRVDPGAKEALDDVNLLFAIGKSNINPRPDGRRGKNHVVFQEFLLNVREESLDGRLILFIRGNQSSANVLNISNCRQQTAACLPSLTPASLSEDHARSHRFRRFDDERETD